MFPDMPLLVSSICATAPWVYIIVIWSLGDFCYELVLIILFTVELAGWGWVGWVWVCARPNCSPLYWVPFIADPVRPCYHVDCWPGTFRFQWMVLGGVLEVRVECVWRCDELPSLETQPDHLIVSQVKLGSHTNTTQYTAQPYWGPHWWCTTCLSRR